MKEMIITTALVFSFFLQRKQEAKSRAGKHPAGRNMEAAEGNRD
jgi:hypothetical protein